MTILYNGWTTPIVPNPERSRAGYLLGQLQDLLGADDYLAWFCENVTSSTPWAEVCLMAAAMLVDDCMCCADDRRCTCKPGNDDIPYWS